MAGLWWVTQRIFKLIKGISNSLDNASGQIDNASTQVSQGSQQLASGASEQASNLEEISSNLEELTSMSIQNSENSAEIKRLMEGEVAEVYSIINARVAEMGETMAATVEASNEMAKVIKSIDEIAFQTNLLALNAAVDAARAGEAGKGFAVVAEEVRNLAQRSADAAKNTAQLIQETDSKVNEVVKQNNDVLEAMKKNENHAGKVAHLVSEVNAASQEQSVGIEQINTAIAQLNQVTQSNAANAEESASASEELSAQSRELSHMVGSLVKLVEGGGNVHIQRSYHGESDNLYADRLGPHSGKGKRKSKYNGNGNGRKSQTVNQNLTPDKIKVLTPEEVIPLMDSDMEDF
jgi:methyl-accepting chemotaxis protein